MREIADDMDGRRRGVFEEAVEQMKALCDLTRRRYEEKKTAAGETPDDEECRREISYEAESPGRTRRAAARPLKPEERKQLKETRAWRSLQSRDYRSDAGRSSHRREALV